MKKDPALTCSNPRLIAGVYFGLLSVVGTILINAFLTILGIEEQVPLYAAILLGMVISSCTAALMGPQLIRCPKPYKVRVFLTGFFMVIVSLPLFDLGLLYLMQEKQNPSQLLNYYVYITLYSYVLFGIALALGSGVAALYLRSQLVYDILATYQPKLIKKLPDSPLEKSKVEHSDRVSLNINQEEKADIPYVRPKK